MALVAKEVYGAKDVSFIGDAAAKLERAYIKALADAGADVIVMSDPSASQHSNALRLAPHEWRVIWSAYRGRRGAQAPEGRGA